MTAKKHCMSYIWEMTTPENPRPSIRTMSLQEHRLAPHHFRILASAATVPTYNALC
jgi:hypothetical protein